MASPLNPHVNAHPLAGAYTNAYEVAAALDASGDRSVAKARSITRHHAMLLQVRIQANAHGRPGPRAITGDYQRSWTTSFRPIPGGGSGIVGTNKPQARRLEYGFVGPDRIGRVYNQPPYPHVGPAVDVQSPLFTHALRDAATLGGT